MTKSSNGRALSDEELVEFIRYAVLARGGFDLSDEFSAAVYSTWYLLNPLGLGNRDTAGSPRRDGDKKEIVFTAHSHPKEPQIPSPDDIAVYSAMKTDGTDAVNFITDRFSCKKIL